VVDSLSKARRSWNMSRIRGKDTEPERVVRSALHRIGFRFRLHVKSLPGKPDIVLPRYKTVVFVDGCYWHRHPLCKNATTPSTRTAFWTHKFASNKRNDRLVRQRLTSLGWTVESVWECEVAHEKKNYVALLRRLSRRRRRYIGVAHPA
jgi:DNA mismatch endonuclease, patch repair protein